ncbi:leucine-rich repeat extensin-like protein 5 [Mustela putorius furo]|uniref:Leucine-rich repeat extensin-like protein 5 n=1 Tax=Mustela putorius furo TaxID=9669 RepID=A0A8U0SBY5_MUSPF|nr:leucine-rich repeat extensin-like protein 5 [Mustela putorius furo]
MAPETGSLPCPPRTPREPVTPQSEGLAKGPTSPLPSARRPGGAAVPSAAEEGRSAGPARLSSAGTRQLCGAPPEAARNKREGKALRTPLPGVPSPAREPLAPAPRGLPDRGHGARAAPRSPHEKKGETPPYSPTVSSPSAVYLTVPPAYRAPPSWTYSTSPRRERSTAAAASATKKSSHLGLACLSTPATDDRSRQPRWTEEAFLVISDNAGGTLEPPCGRSSPAGLSPPVLVRLSPCDKKQRS